MVPSRSGLIALALLGSALGFAPRASPARHRCARPAASTTAEDEFRWRQSPDFVELVVPVAATTTAADIALEVSARRVRLSAGGAR